MQFHFSAVALVGLLCSLALLSDYIQSAHGLSTVDSVRRNRGFTFSSVNGSSGGGNGGQSIGSPSATVMTRQLIVGSISPFTVPASSTSYCICVPPGSCSNSNNDGSGQIDVRIVNNSTSPTVTPTFCNYGLTLCCLAGSYQCGRRYSPPPGSTPGGAGQAQFGEYPWVAALLTNNEVYLGAGALITAQHVLTAAHKVYNISTSTFKVRVGEWDAASTSEPIPAQDVLIAAVYLHPNFNSANLQNDIAIIQLATAVSLTTKSTVGTVCLPTTTFVGQTCYVAGWGKNDFGPTGAYQAIEREVDVPLITNAACQSLLQATRLGSSFQLNNSSFICAGGQAGKDACTGDGGAPLVCQSNNIWYVVGLVAWGIGCGQGGVPGVYVNVATYLAWIQTVLASS
ncbi:chymotrypsin-like protease CTRL-1 isoform X1 [Rhagoletis pomonella]|uniref:chymotrypsin-like protease CTRL-1 isoform X1 n=2 Tax=Rhagoletis pomonella TaxID=28610 RepID=UPI00177D491D|nr:chymotrypsin-like protease CTRL-1 isoform X1 [Rhagoletis pomonella]